MEAPQVYQDIGHGLDCYHSSIWLFNGFSVLYRSAKICTHEEMWGRTVIKFWRGRFDTKTQRLSVAAPEGETRDISALIVEQLRVKFGNKIEIWQFNPTRRVE